MSWLEFITSLARALAWPGTVIVLALVFRSSIRSALAGLTRGRIKVGPAEAELEWERLVSEAAQQLRPDVAEGVELGFGGGLAGELNPLAQVDPRAAVMEGFTRIETALRRLVETTDFDPPLSGALLDRLNANQLAAIAHSAGRINDAVVRAIEGLTVMRNLVMYGGAGELDTEQAREFINLADAVLYLLAIASLHGIGGASSPSRPVNKRPRSNRTPPGEPSGKPTVGD